MKGNVGNVGSRRVAWALVEQSKYASALHKQRVVVVNSSSKLSLFDVLVAIAIPIAVVVAKVPWYLGSSFLPPPPHPPFLWGINCFTQGCTLLLCLRPRPKVELFMRPSKL